MIADPEAFREYNAKNPIYLYDGYSKNGATADNPACYANGSNYSSQFEFCQSTVDEYYDWLKEYMYEIEQTMSTDQIKYEVKKNDKYIYVNKRVSGSDVGPIFMMKSQETDGGDDVCTC